VNNIVRPYLREGEGRWREENYDYYNELSMKKKKIQM
jgi:hypothetical protein